MLLAARRSHIQINLDSKENNRMRKWMMSSVLMTALVSTLLTATSFGQAPAAKKPLYERLGGQPAMQAVANSLVDKILADNRVNKWFAHAASTPENTAAYKAKLTAFICKAVGGPCNYTGRDMVTAHRGRDVTNEAFNAVVEDLTAVLDQLKVPAPEKSEVLQLIGTLRTSIVQNGTGAGK
jgi:hemoglobin